MNQMSFERRHWQNVKSYLRATQNIYHVGIGRLASLYADMPLVSGADLFKNNPSLKAAVTAELKVMARKLDAVIKRGCANEWLLMNRKSDNVLSLLLGGKTLPTSLQVLYYDRNRAALEAFKERTIDGLKISGRVWNIIKGYTIEIEAAMSVGLQEGTSAAKLATDMKKYLNEPDRLYRRVRDSKGKLQLSSTAEKYRPGRGVYRSSYKNALRLTRTETNVAYRTADFHKNQQLDFVLGFEVRRSNAAYDCDFCDEHAGFYPKEFMFTGWHPQCMCHTVTVLPSGEDFWKSVEAKMYGKSYSFDGKIKEFTPTDSRAAKQFRVPEEKNPPVPVLRPS